MYTQCILDADGMYMVVGVQVKIGFGEHKQREFGQCIISVWKVHIEN